MSQPSSPSDANPAVRRVTLRQFVSQRSVGDWIAVTAIALGAAALLVMFPLVRICDQHLTDAGKVETVCRHLALNDPPVVVVGALVVLAMSAFFAEVSVSGLTLKGRVELVERKQDFVEQKQDLVEQKADLATVEAGRANETATTAQVEAREALAAATKYNRVRRDLKPRTPERDAAQAESWDTLIEDLRNNADFDLDEHLESQIEGTVLAGFAWALTHPDASRAEKVAEAMFKAKGFTQEKGIQALAATVSQDCAALSPLMRERLRDLRRKVSLKAQQRNGTSNRAREIDRLLRNCQD